MRMRRVYALIKPTRGHSINSDGNYTRSAKTSTPMYKPSCWLRKRSHPQVRRKPGRAIIRKMYAWLSSVAFSTTLLNASCSCRWTIKASKITLIFEHCKGDKTMRDELPVGYSKALLEWLHVYYGASVGSMPGDTLLWVSLTVNTKQYGRPLGIRAIERLCIKHLEVHTHVTRHSFAHAMIKAGATLPELQDRLGHNSLATTGIYARVFTGAKNPHANKLAELFGIE